MGSLTNRCSGTGQLAIAARDGIGEQCPVCGMRTIPFENGRVRKHNTLIPQPAPQDIEHANVRKDRARDHDNVRDRTRCDDSQFGTQADDSAADRPVLAALSPAALIPQPAARPADLSWVNLVARMLTKTALWSELTPFQQEQRITRAYLDRFAALASPPPAERPARMLSDDRVRALWRSVTGPYAELPGPLIRYAALLFEAGRCAAERPSWQPIETAPQEQRVLVMLKPQPLETAGEITFAYFVINLPDSPAGVWTRDETDESCVPTHWMPLPDPASVPATNVDAP